MAKDRDRPHIAEVMPDEPASEGRAASARRGVASVHRPVRILQLDSRAVASGARCSRPIQRNLRMQPPASVALHARFVVNGPAV